MLSQDITGSLLTVTQSF